MTVTSGPAGGEGRRGCPALPPAAHTPSWQLPPWSCTHTIEEEEEDEKEEEEEEEEKAEEEKEEEEEE